MKRILTIVLVSFLGAAPLCLLAVAPLSSLAYAQHSAGNHSSKTASSKPQKKRTAQWKRGGKYKGQGLPLTNFRQFNLKTPAKGQRWIRENGHFLLVRTDTGVIVSIIER